MRRHVNKVAVLGSGVMGSAIAAHFANAGIAALVLDIVPSEPTQEEKQAGLTLQDRRVRNRIVDSSVRALLKAKPSPLFTPERLELVETGNFEDDLPRLAEADWVIEAVREEMAVKTSLLAEAAPHLRDDAVLTSNTSGLSLTEMAGALPEKLRPRFLGTHFFNPPRYMRLLELIPTPHTAPEIAAMVEEFAVVRLGKGIVHAKDTPNFVANRIGVHAMVVALRVMQEEKLTIEEVDALTGPALGRPKTGTFRLADLVGIDVIALVARHLRHAAADESREVFETPEFIGRMIEAGLLGAKSGRGFYQKARGPERKILTLDLERLEYRDPRPAELPELVELRSLADPAERIRRLVGGEGRGARAAWRMLAATLSYAALRVGEIADDAHTIDLAMKLGFNWELGPFEIWDALGFAATAERLERDGYALPDWLQQMVARGEEGFYRRSDGRVTTPTADPGRRAEVRTDSRVIVLDELRTVGKEVRRNESAALIDLGDGALCLEFRTKMNALDDGCIAMMMAAADEAEANWQAVVVANDGDAFCAGANLRTLVQKATAADWAGIEQMIRAFQSACTRLETCAVPVVVAPHAMALGGGCEVVLAGDAVQADAESYIGLVEVGAGLLPAGGGCLRLYRRNLARLSDGIDVYAPLTRTFETIGMAKVSTSAEHARDLGFLRPQDGWTMNRAQRIHDAKQRALALARSGYAPPRPGRVTCLGRSGLALLETMLINMAEGRFISEHDRKIGGEVARVLCGGDVVGPTTVSEQHLLDLEAEGFLRLCGEPKTHERIAALLKTGKPLRN